MTTAPWPSGHHTRPLLPNIQGVAAPAALPATSLAPATTQLLANLSMAAPRVEVPALLAIRAGN